MRTHGPRMNRERTREVIDALNISVVKSDGDGIEIHRTIEVKSDDVTLAFPERWRVLTGGGIAGNSDQVWLRPVGRLYNLEGERKTPRGPFWNKTQLEKALRAWRRGE